MTELTYRDALPPDLPKIVEIYNSTIASGMVTADTAPVSVASKQQWFQEHHPSKRPLWIVEDPDHSIVGWLSLHSFYGRPAYEATVEISIYLGESQRGKGLGKQILQHCIKAAPALGVKTLLAFIFSHNLPSLKLFHNFGFEDWGCLPDVAMVAGKERSLCILGKRLG